MSGHSKWSTIKRKKAANDAKRSKIWTKVVKEITVAARTGGEDPAGNPRLRLALDKARAANLPKDSINRAIEKGVGGGGGNDEEVNYEGYGPGGVAVVVECMTDNRNRTVAELRHSFEKYGGQLGTSGSVAWMFRKRGMIHVLQADTDEDTMMEIALEAGAEDIRGEEDVWVVQTEPSAFLAVQDALTAAGIEIANSEIDNLPDNRVILDKDKAVSVLKMIQLLEDLDDVQNVYANHEIPDELLDEIDL